MLRTNPASPDVLAGAEREAARILSQAGVNAIYCPAKYATVAQESICRIGWGPQNIGLRLLSKHASTGFQDFMFGFSVAPGLANQWPSRRRKSQRIRKQVQTRNESAFARRYF